jgi:rhodanese-related sulfurtransferase
MMAKQHDPNFEALSTDAKTRIKEIEIDEVAAGLESGRDFVVFDVREDHEWNAGHLKGAEHLGRGIIERDIAKRVDAQDKEIVLYCGGGHRSAMAADNLQKMGYTKVYSMAGGIRAWKEANLPME